MEKWQAIKVLEGNLKALEAKLEDLKGISISREDFEQRKREMISENKICLKIIHS